MVDLFDYHSTPRGDSVKLFVQYFNKERLEVSKNFLEKHINSEAEVPSFIISTNGRSSKVVCHGEGRGGALHRTKYAKISTGDF